MTTPEFDSAGGAGYGAGVPQDRGNGASDNASSGPTDEVSFARSRGIDQTSDTVEKARDVARRGMASAEDALSELQGKAGELTSNLINKIDIDALTAKLEEQVREHPGRTLMFVAGAGFLLGRAAKK